MQIIGKMKAIVIAIILSCLSCATVARKVSGVSRPGLESRQSINAYLDRHEIDTSRVYVFKNLMAFAMASEQGFLSFPNAYFFNNQGQSVEYPKTAAHCNAQVGSFIRDLKGFSAWPAQDKKMAAFTRLLSPEISGTPISDITVLITFTTYSGKLNKEKAFEWIQLLEKAKQDGISVDYYLVSADFMQTWNIPLSLQKKWGIKQ